MAIKEFKLESYISREERHYCAFLFRWLLESRENVSQLLLGRSKLGEEYRLFYEYTAIREYLFSLKKRMGGVEYKQIKDILNQKLVNFDRPNPDQTNDIQKKKIDLALQTCIDGKTIIYLVEAKFEEGFDIDQLLLTENYGKILKELFSVDYEVIVLGLEYYLNKKGLERYHKLSWESLVEKIDDPIVKNEIVKGLEYEYQIHPRTKIKS